MSQEIIESKYHNASIYQSRPLIEACKQFDLNEGRLFYLGLMELKPQLSDGNGQVEFEKIVIPTADVIKLFGGNASYYTKLRPIARKLRGRGITVKEGDESFHDISIFRNMQFDKKLGGLVIHFNDDMRPYILELQGKPYTRIAAKTIFSLSSMYAIRLMELMLDYQNIPTFRKSHVIRRSIDVAELRFYCGIGDTKYRKVTDFTKNVVQKPCAEINASTPYEIEFAVIREGRNVRGYSFVMRTPVHEDEVDTVEQIVEIKQTERLEKTRRAGRLIDSPNADLYELLISYGVGKIIARRLVKNYARERIVNNIRYAIEKSNVKKMGAYVRIAIEEDYAASADIQPSLFDEHDSDQTAEGRALPAEDKDLQLTGRPLSADSRSFPLSGRTLPEDDRSLQLSGREKLEKLEKIGQLIRLGVSEMYAVLMVDAAVKQERFSFSERSVCETLGLDADAVYAAIMSSDFSGLSGGAAEPSRPEKERQERQERRRDEQAGRNGRHVAGMNRSAGTAGLGEFTEDDENDMLFLMECEEEGKLTSMLAEKLRGLREKYRRSKKA